MIITTDENGNVVDSLKQRNEQQLSIFDIIDD